MNSTKVNNIVGVILAGGLSRRMGYADKFFLKHQGKSLLQHTIDRASTQVDKLLISGNGDVTRFHSYNLNVITDGENEQAGPLAGIISAMQWATVNTPKTRWLMTFASDTPNFPLDCTARLQECMESKNLDVAICSTAANAHYTFALWSINMLPYLNIAVAQGTRALHSLIKPLNHDFVDFKGQENTFFNINTPKDWAKFNQPNHTDKQ